MQALRLVLGLALTLVCLGIAGRRAHLDATLALLATVTDGLTNTRPPTPSRHSPT